MYVKIAKAMGEQYRENIDLILTFCTCVLLRSICCDKSLVRRDYHIVRYDYYRQQINNRKIIEKKRSKEKKINYADACRNIFENILLLF